ncbi:MAG: hypothetical protein FJX72_17750 [Armatimonadetes bacterium]|nr:hypothetical protein [Armatimonadota bacterium]
MKTHIRRATALAAASLVIGGVAGAQLGSVLKGGAVAVAVSKYGKQINDAINQLTGQKNVGNRQATKVVPILSIGDGGHVGAVQVAGPERLLNRVEAVAQLEGRFKAIGGVRLRALVPISTKTPHKGLNRVEGVGVSAIVDLKL